MVKVKLSDIAKKAGVSVAAVSLALNGRPGVSEETRRMIFDIMEETGYRAPNREKVRDKNDSEKNMLFLNCSRTSITNDIFPQTPYFSELLRAFEVKLSDSGYRLWVRSLHIDTNFEQNVKTLLKNQDVDGILLVATDMLEEDVKIIQRIEPNVVVLDSCYERLNVNCVVMDNYLGGVIAAKHMLKCGHKNIGYVQSKIRIFNFDSRKKGFMDELARNGISISEDNIFSTESSVDASYETLSQQIKGIKRIPTCFFAENDYMAIGMLRALQSNGISVPDEVSLVGFDNIDMASIVAPALTTINVPKNKLADCCISQIKYFLNHDSALGLKQYVSVDLIKRESTKII